MVTQEVYRKCSDEWRESQYPPSQPPKFFADYFSITRHIARHVD